MEEDIYVSVEEDTLDADQMKLPAIGLESANRAQQCRPLEIVDGRADIVHARQQIKILDVENSRCFIGPFD